MTGKSDIPGAQPTLIEVAVEPRSEVDREKLGVALAKLTAEDPSFRVSTRPDLPLAPGVIDPIANFIMIAKVGPAARAAPCAMMAC